MIAHNLLRWSAFKRIYNADVGSGTFLMNAHRAPCAISSIHTLEQVHGLPLANDLTGVAQDAPHTLCAQGTSTTAASMRQPFQDP